jgi:hypothetical protein
MGHSRQGAVIERETGSQVGTRPLLQDGSWPDGDILH